MLQSCSLEIIPALMNMTPVFTALLVALVNGIFIIYVKRKFDRDIEILRNELSLLRDLAVKHFDRRADIYYDAIEPFIRLFILTGSRNGLTQDDAKKFLETAYLASARIQLFGSETVHLRFCEMLDWTTGMLDTPQAKVPSNSSDTALNLARTFLNAARDDLFPKSKSNK
jgi:hypothetical protein